MISFAEREYTDKEVFQTLNPGIKKWFKRKFKTFAPCQKYAVKGIHNGKNVLIFSPIESGKTGLERSIRYPLVFVDIAGKL